MRRTLWLVLLGVLSFSQINCGPKAPSSPGAPGAESSYSFITNFGQYGYPEYPYSFYEISGIAVSGNKIYVSDVDYWDVEVYDLNGNYLSYVWLYDTNGNETYPYSMTADKFGHLYIADPYYLNDEVDVINAADIPATVTGAYVTVGQSYGGDCGPTAVAVDGNGLIYVGDQGCAEIYTIEQAGGSGGGVYTSDGSVSINGGFLGSNGPYGIAVNAAGNTVYVADSSNNVVQVYDGGLNWLSVIGDVAGAPGTATGKFDFPAGLTVDNDGNLLVADTDNARIQKFSPSGTYLNSIGNTATNVSNGQLYSPWQLAVDASNGLYVTDTNYETVFKYASN